MYRSLLSVPLVGLFLSVAVAQDSKKDAKGLEGRPPPRPIAAALPEIGEVDVHFLNTSTVRMTVRSEHLEITTIYGKLAVPVRDIRLIEFGLHFPEGVEAVGETIAQADDANYKNYSQNTYGAAFAEVAVDIATGEIRLRRMTGVFAAGRIINTKTARSQLMGGMIWGVSSALHEAASVDPRYGNWVNGDLAEYLVPVHADIPEIEAILLDDYDEHANHLGMKGVGELGVCGTGAAVANAVFNATGVRVRDFPITMDKLLSGLPPIND